MPELRGNRTLQGVLSDSCAGGSGKTLRLALSASGGNAVVAGELAFHDEETPVIDSVIHDERLPRHRATQLFLQLSPVPYHEIGRFGESGFRTPVALEALIWDGCLHSSLSFLFDSANQQARSISRNAIIGGTRRFLEGLVPHSRITPFGLDRLYLIGDQSLHIIRNKSDGMQEMLSPDRQQVIRTFGRNAKGGIPEHYNKQKSEWVAYVPGDPASVATVQTIFHLRYVEHLGMYCIAKRLNDMGLPAPQGGN